VSPGQGFGPYPPARWEKRRKVECPVKPRFYAQINVETVYGKNLEAISIVIAGRHHGSVETYNVRLRFAQGGDDIAEVLEARFDVFDGVFCEVPKSHLINTSSGDQSKILIKSRRKKPRR
jgi:hypothetical protein